jgi:hypothetical protein
MAEEPAAERVAGLDGMKNAIDIQEQQVAGVTNVGGARSCHPTKPAWKDSRRSSTSAARPSATSDSAVL